MPIIQDSVFRTSDGCSLGYTLRVSTDAQHRIALIHSLALDRSIWDRVVGAIGGAASILTYDCRGHGKSERSVSDSFTPDLFAQDLAELLEHVEWTSAVVAGCSMGGNAAQAFGYLFPSRASALGLIDTTAFYGEDAPIKWRERAKAARLSGLASMIAFQNTRWFTDAFRATYPDLIARLNEVFLSNDLDCYAATCEMLGHLDLRPYLPSLKMPVAIVVGEEDYATPVAASEQLHAAIPDSTLTILPGRHLTPIERPAEVASNLLELARRAESNATPWAVISGKPGERA
jgi:3-oxoadipate enol-lactonase